ncbi:MAG: FkbM family methyltransferase [Pseudomonadota bacterium]
MTMPKPETTGPDSFDLSAALFALADGQPVKFPPMQTLHFPGPPPLHLHLNMWRDPIQRELRQGRFYEEAELTALAGLIGPGAQIIDVGANIGNHLLWFLTRMDAARVWPVEPNPLALAPLMANILANGLMDRTGVRGLGLGLNNAAAEGFSMARHDRNLGATRLREGGGEIATARGDELFAEVAPDLIKIDVEGMEMSVLWGLEGTIAAHKPILLVEVFHDTQAEFSAWLDARGYHITSQTKVSRLNSNFLAVPRL